MNHYFTKNSNIKSEEKIINIIFKNTQYKFYTDNGVFSKSNLDFGTRSLLQTLDFNVISGDILDIGCGYGPIGIIVAKNTESVVDMADINDRAVNLSKKNCKLNNINNTNVFESDAYENINKKYDYIITNPPIRVGKKILYNILFGAKQFLKDDGELRLVINKSQGAKSLICDLEKEYNVKVIDKNKGFFVISATIN